MRVFNLAFNPLSLSPFHIFDDICVESNVLVTLEVEFANPVHLSDYLNIVTANQAESVGQLDQGLHIGRRVECDMVLVAAPTEQTPRHCILDQAVVQVEVEEQLGCPEAEHVLLPQHPHHLPHRPLHLLRLQLPAHKSLTPCSHFSLLLLLILPPHFLLLPLTPQAITMEEVVLAEETPSLCQRFEGVEVADPQVVQ